MKPGMVPDIFQPETFYIHGYETDPQKGIVRFRFSFDDKIEFVEEIDFGKSFPEEDTALQAVLNDLAVALGVSYYKAYVPARIDVSKLMLSKDALSFFQDFYLQGLGEFACRNELDLRRSINFSAAQDARGTQDLSLPRRSLVLIGGGKDSLVTLETLKQADEEMTLFAVNPAAPIIDCAEKSGLELISVKRKIDARLFELNQQGVYNGHVPVTGIISFIAVASAIIHGFDTIILSNERSANEGNTEYLGMAVNHQYSKSLDFERGFAAYLEKSVSKSLTYFSFLRPLSEIHIAQLFGAQTDVYDEVFTSCNKAFKIHDKPSVGWCCDCPKCRFVFLILATAMPKARLETIFGGNMLEDKDQMDGFSELVGLKNHKPWECVGETLECAAALAELQSRAEWKDAAIVQELAPQLSALKKDLRAVYEDMLKPSAEHNMPKRYMDILNDRMERG